MKILVACEELQAVTIELRKLGHEAYSSDLEPCSGGHPEWHLQVDALELLDGKRFGPCIPNVYYAFCHYGGMPIICAEKVEIKFPVLDKTVIDRLIEQKRGLPPWELVRDAQRTGGAWDIVYQNGTDEKKVIEKGLMKVRRMTK